MSNKVFLFDLDGTIIDSSKGITNAVKYSLNILGYEIPNQEILNKFIGPPLDDSYSKYFGMLEEEWNEAIKHFKKYYEDKGMYELKIYDDLEELLSKLSKRHKLYVATSKDEKNANKIIKNLKIDKYFNYIAGASLETRRSRKEDVIKYLLQREKENLKNNEIIMVGDTKFDIIGANMNNMKSIGVLYGFGTREELENENATFIVEKPLDILDLEI